MPIWEGVITPVVVEFFNDIFDSVNGKNNQPPKEKNELRKEVSNISFHFLFWKEAETCMKEYLRFINSTTKKKTEICTIIKRLLTVMANFEGTWI